MPYPRWRRPCATWLVAALLAACAEEAVEEAVPAAVAPAAPTVEIERVDVAVHEGTNLAVTVDPATNNRVLSLQGQLFLVDGESGTAT